MRRGLAATGRAVVLAVTCGVLGAGVSAAQMAHQPGMTYDVKTETTLTGTIDDIMQMSGTSAMSGVHLAVRTEAETIHVHLGPVAFVEGSGVTFAKGESVTVTGSRIRGDGFEAILARTVKVGDKTLTLRDDKGMPRWQMGG